MIQESLTDKNYKKGGGKYLLSSFGTQSSSDVRRACRVCKESLGSTYLSKSK